MYIGLLAESSADCTDEPIQFVGINFINEFTLSRCGDIGNLDRFVSGYLDSCTILDDIDNGNRLCEFRRMKNENCRGIITNVTHGCTFWEMRIIPGDPIWLVDSTRSS